MRYRETMQFLRPLFMRLKARSLDAEMLAGLKMIVDALRSRNYLHAYEARQPPLTGSSPGA